MPVALVLSRRERHRHGQRVGVGSFAPCLVVRKREMPASLARHAPDALLTEESDAADNTAVPGRLMTPDYIRIRPEFTAWAVG